MLEKIQLVDKIEVIENGIVQVRTKTAIMEDGVELSKTYHRHCIAPGQDFSSEDKMVRDICAAVHTPEKITAYAQQMERPE